MRTTWFAAILVLTSFEAFAQMSPSNIPSAHFAALDGYTQAEISPDGRHLAYLYPIDDRRHLIIYTFESDSNIVVPPEDGADFLWIRWANDETLVYSLALSVTRRGHFLIETEDTRLAGINVNSKEIVALIPSAEKVGTTGSRTSRAYYPVPQIQDNVIDWMVDDPDHILVSVDEDWDTRYEVREVDVNSGDYRIHRRSIEGVQDWVVDQSGEVRLGYGVRLGEQRIVFKDAAGDWLTMEKVDWYEAGWRPFLFTEDPEVIYVVGPGEYGTDEIRTLNTQTGEFVDTIFSNATYDVDGLMTHPVTDEPIGIAYTDHFQRYEYFDESFDVLQRSIDRVLPDAQNVIRSATRDLSKIVIVSSSSREAGMVVIWDRTAKTFEPFGWYNENLDPEMMADVNPVEYSSDDGTVIPAYLTLPRNTEAQNLPTVVLPHGGPAVRDDSSFWFLSQFLVSRGYAVLQPNFRGSDGYGREFRYAGRGQWGGLMQDDVDAGTRWLIEEGIADPERICIVGWSYGGYSAAIGLVRTPDLYTCGVGINGVYNLPQKISDDLEFVGGTFWTRHIGLEGENTRRVSPYHQAAAIEAPMLIVHAEDDHRVRVMQAEQFHEELQDKGKQSSLVIVEHGGHSMVNADARQRILDEIERFLGMHLGAR